MWVLPHNYPDISSAPSSQCRGDRVLARKDTVNLPSIAQICKESYFQKGVGRREVSLRGSNRGREETESPMGAKGVPGTGRTSWLFTSPSLE